MVNLHINARPRENHEMRPFGVALEWLRSTMAKHLKERKKKEKKSRAAQSLFVVFAPQCEALRAKGTVKLCASIPGFFSVLPVSI
jgi:hypothetical protein